MDRAGWAFLLWVALSLPACSEPAPPPVVECLLKAYNEHDWSAAAAYLAEDVTFEGPDHDPIVGAAKVAGRLSWGTTLGSVWTLDGVAERRALRTFRPQPGPSNPPTGRNSAVVLNMCADTRMASRPPR